MSSFAESTKIIIPTYNEEETIGTVITDFQSEGYDEILVIDGDSSDGTRETAEEHGAEVVTQSGSGKGQAVRESFEKYSDSDYIVLVDGDDTYCADEIERIIAPLATGVSDHVIGNRFANLEKGALTKLNFLGNISLNTLFGLLHGDFVPDVLSGYRAFNQTALETMELESDGFEIETELTVESVHKGLSLTTVPITYENRPDESDTKLHPFKDGLRIGKEMVRLRLSR